MQKSKLLVAVLGALCAMPVLAADAPASAFTPSANVAIVSNYLYRGISQTGAKPALQGGFDLAHESGAYIGVWASSISWISDSGSATNAGTEFDTYLGYKGAVGDVGYDVGFLRYNYPGVYSATPADTNEVYGAVSYSFLTAKYSYSLGDTFGIAEAKGTSYMELNANYAVGETGYTLGAHYGKQDYKGPNMGNLSYADYKVSVNKDFSGYVVGLAYSSTNADETSYTVLTKNLGKSATVLSLSRAF